MKRRVCNKSEPLYKFMKHNIGNITLTILSMSILCTGSDNCFLNPDLCGEEGICTFLGGETVNPIKITKLIY